MHRQCRVNDGSAPRVRGTGVTDSVALNETRFSPACAGNGAAHGLTALAAPVQARVCGERLPPHLQAVSKPGSAPRVRGTEKYGDAWKRDRRFSPACAGNG